MQQTLLCINLCLHSCLFFSNGCLEVKLLGQSGDVVNFYVHIVDYLPEKDVLINICASIIMKCLLQTPASS